MPRLSRDQYTTVLDPTLPPAITIASGEELTTDLIGPPTTAYVDSTTCRLVGQ